ncbi:N-acetylmuramic acid 6-phosphate etherase [Cryptosporangium japonicum]|uniref:N-acetylmuramic acid 6-phosphate etherase n=1 Tax=Cryptosporangium japonicum TaxID=80872 RepID=A0ABN0USK6_9ACTN
MIPLDELSALGVAQRLFDAEARVLPAVRAAAPRVAEAAELIAARMAEGGRLVLIGAGTSGRLAVLQAAELPGTFGLAVDRVAARTAGGGPGGLTGTDGDEDDVDAGRRDLLETGFAAGDTLVAVAASGRTPYTLAAVAAARELGASVVSVTTVASSPLAEAADVAIEVPMGPEALRGSTRLTAGTTQKLLLDALTTAAMVRLGRVHGDVMIDVVPANAKLRLRSAGLVAEIVGCDPAEALGVLDECGGNARAAVLVLSSGLGPDDAAALAAGHRTLRAAMAASS